MIRRRDLIGLADLERSEIEHLLDSAARFRGVLDRVVPKVPTLRGQTIANLFFEPSTRTRISFELAEKRLSADSINFSASGSSLSKGESLLDTTLNIQAMKVDVLVVRHSSAGAAAYLARHLEAAVLNAGDGFHEHPTQALLDMYTIREHLGRIAGLKVAIIGDITHSRVARSNIWGLTKLGAEVTVCGPSTMLPFAVERLGCAATNSIEQAISGVDVVMALRIQRERQHGGLLPSLREYARLFAITPARLELAHENAIVMHPGPMNRGIEIDPGVADGPRSVILNQVTNGVAVRMAALFWASGLDQVSERERLAATGADRDGAAGGTGGGTGGGEQAGAADGGSDGAADSSGEIGRGADGDRTRGASAGNVGGEGAGAEGADWVRARTTGVIGQQATDAGGDQPGGVVTVPEQRMRSARSVVTGVPETSGVRFAAPAVIPPRRDTRAEVSGIDMSSQSSHSSQSFNSSHGFNNEEIHG